MRKAVDFEDFSQTCPWAYTHGEGYINNGYNCSHPRQETTEDDNGQVIGRCHCFSCPLGIAAEVQDIDPDPNDTDAIQDGIDWSNITSEPKPSADDIGEDDILLIDKEAQKDSDEAEALFWYELHMHRYDSEWCNAHDGYVKFYNDRPNEKRMPKEDNDDA